ncbi:MAG: efflux RND transporter periplasmic adaptor subunit [Calditrichia bacterium]
MKRNSILLICATIVAMLLAGCGADDSTVESIAEKATPVRVVTVQKVSLSPAIRTAGVLATKAESRLSFKIGGILQRLAVDEGAEVKKGQLLAHLDRREINAQVVAAQSGYDKAERDLKRVTALYSDSVITLEQLQNSKTALAVAGSQLEITKFNQRHAAIYAPANGKMLKRFVERDELVGPGTPIFTFSSSSDSWIVRCGVSDRDLVALKMGDKASVTFDPYPGETFSGEVVEIASAVDSRSGTYEVEIRLDKTPLRLISGFVASVELTPSKGTSLSLIPSEALVEGDGQRGKIFLADGNTARRTQIDIAHILADNIAVSTPLQPGAAVITDGSAYVRDGQTIDIVQ